MHDDAWKDWATSRSLFYGLDHQPINPEEATRLLGDAKARTVARAAFADGSWVSTVFLVVDHNLTDDGPPVLYETMAFAADGIDERVTRYTSRAGALLGHRRIVGELTEAHGPALDDPEVGSGD